MALKVRMDDHNLVTVRVEGNLDIYTITRLRMRLAHFDLSDGRVILDLSQITLIDSAGLGTLLSLANRARRDGGRLPVICTAELADVLQIARLADAFDLTVVDGTMASVG